MTAADVMTLARELGHGLKLGDDGSLLLTGRSQPETPMLVRVLKHHRTELLEAVRNQPEIPDFARPMQCRWGLGYVGRHWFPDKGWPVGARCWRYEGEGDDAWRPIPEVEMRKTSWPSAEAYDRMRAAGERRT